MLENKIVQWNIGGLTADKKNQLKLLRQEINPFVFCLQETHFTAKSVVNFPGYQTFFRSSSKNRPTGGVAILIKNNFSCKKITLNTNLQAIAVEIYYPTKYIICNVYIPPLRELTVRDLNKLASQLGDEFIILGDFNSHNSLWGSKKIDRKGKNVEEFLDGSDAMILNTGENTHLNYGSKTFTAIDLAMATPNLFSMIKWSVEKDLRLSDHFPIVLEFPGHQTFNEPQKWKINQADWGKFFINCNFENESDWKELEINDHEEMIRNAILEAADKSIPKTSGKIQKKYVPWWTKEIGFLIKDKRKLMRLYKTRKNHGTLVRYKRKRDELRGLIRKEKTRTWEKFVSDINTEDSTSELFNKVRKISGNYRGKNITTLKIGNNIITDPNDIVKELGENYKNTTSFDNYKTAFREKMARLEEIEQEIPANKGEPYNEPLTLEELEEALRECTGTSPGTDTIRYEMLKNLTPGGKLALINLYNKIWEKGKLPNIWKEAISIPIAKPGKDTKDPNNYRTIQLTNCTCKLMEKIVNKRLQWTLESIDGLNRAQSGFRKSRSTADSLTELEWEIKKAFSENGYLLTVSFDLRKAYDVTWRRLVLRNLLKMGISGNMAKFVSDFMNGRESKIKMGRYESEKIIQETGLVQGAVLSVTLFIVAMNELLTGLENVSKVMFADDLTVFVRGKNLGDLGSMMQEVIDKVTRKAEGMGYTFAEDKTSPIIFTRKRRRAPDPTLVCNGKILEYKKSHRILGMIFDQKLNWEEHIMEVKNKAKKRLNILKMLCNVKFGAKRKHLLHIHQSIIVSILEYGAFLYNSAAPSYLKKLEPVHNEGVRIATGAFKSSPTISILADAGALNLEDRRLKQGTKYAIKIKANRKHPIHREIKTLWESEQKTGNTRKKETAMTYYVHKLKEWEIGEEINTYGPRKLPPWGKNTFKIDTSLAKHKREEHSDTELKTLSLEKIASYENKMCIFTDGSKKDEKTGWGFYVEGEWANGRLRDGTSVYTAECTAILEAVKMIAASSDDNILLCTDSLSAIKALQRIYTKNEIIAEMKDIMGTCGKKIDFLWIPSHTGLRGNDKADEVAKNSLTLNPNPDMKPLTLDLRNEVEGRIRLQKEMSWRTLGNNKLREIKPEWGKWKEIDELTRKEAQIITRLRIGHTRLTHGHLMKKEDPRVCECGETMIYEHIFQCKEMENYREYLGIDDRRCLKEEDPIFLRTLIEYLRIMNLSNEI